MGLKMLALAVALLAAAAAAALAVGALRWDAGTRELRARLEAARRAGDARTFDARELAALPAPVQRYLRTVLRDGQPLVAAASMQHRGTFNIGERGERWKPFVSTQRVIMRRPGFDWDARIAMMPGMPVRVHDAYVAGEGILHASLLGLVSLADLRGGGDIAQGELMRFLAEAAWYPTVLLPGQGVTWAPVDGRYADATLADAALAVTLRFGFGDDGLIDTVRAVARARSVDGAIVPTPWQGRFWNYAERDGMRVPLDGEVAWLLPDGTHPYWRGKITRIEFEFVQ